MATAAAVDARRARRVSGDFFRAVVGFGGDPGGDFHGGELSLEFLQRGYARDDGVILVRGARGFESLDVLASLGDGIGGGLQLLRRWSVRPVVYHGCITGIGEPTVGSGWRF